MGASDSGRRLQPRYGQNDPEIAVTRKNYLFVGSDAGGQRAAIVYTIAETAKLNGLDPEAYIAAVLDRLAGGHRISRIDELLPRNLKANRQPT
jgi:hypothetical protein